MYVSSDVNTNDVLLVDKSVGTVFSKWTSYPDVNDMFADPSYLWYNRSVDTSMSFDLHPAVVYEEHCAVSFSQVISGIKSGKISWTGVNFSLPDDFYLRESLNYMYDVNCSLSFEAKKPPDKLDFSIFSTYFGCGFVQAFPVSEFPVEPILPRLRSRVSIQKGFGIIRQGRTQGFTSLLDFSVRVAPLPFLKDQGSDPMDLLDTVVNFSWGVKNIKMPSDDPPKSQIVCEGTLLISRTLL